jgi:hypothetical protein
VVLVSESGFLVGCSKKDEAEAVDSEILPFTGGSRQISKMETDWAIMFPGASSVNREKA